MKARIALGVFLFTAVFAAATFGQPRPLRKIAYTSAYTSLARGCRTIPGNNGSDGAIICKGIGGYEIETYWSAAAMHLAASTKKNDDSFPLAMLDPAFDERRTKVEWRLANGKPFAIIMRIPKYGDPTDGQYFGKVIGEELVIKGLKGFDLDESVDGKTPNANVRAREIADKAYADQH